MSGTTLKDTERIEFLEQALRRVEKERLRLEDDVETLQACVREFLLGLATKEDLGQVLRDTSRDVP
jgi:hypothetical protein